jgi:hypothetical protein
MTTPNAPILRCRINFNFGNGELGNNNFLAYSVCDKVLNTDNDCHQRRCKHRAGPY